MNPWVLAALIYGGMELGGKGLDFFSQKGEEQTARKQIGLGEKQLKATAMMGRREEGRIDKMIQRLIEQQEKEARRGKIAGREARVENRAEREDARLMTMIMALSGMQSQSVQPPSNYPGSILGMMRK